MLYCLDLAIATFNLAVVYDIFHYDAKWFSYFFFLRLR